MRQIFLSLLALILFVIPAQASPNTRAIIAEGNDLSRRETRLSRRISKLNPKDMAIVKARLSKKGKDSDGDGVGDLYEKARGSNLCDADSDDDGSNDNEDEYENDDDKSGEVSVTGRIVSFDDTNSVLVVADKTFTLTDQTTFRRITRSGLAVDACVEVEGYTSTGGINIATKVQKENGCGGGNDDGDDHGDDH